MLLKLVSGFLTLVGLFLFLKKSEKNANNKPKTSTKILRSKYRKLRKFIEAQARHETGNYTSRAYKENNNLFGMKHASKRKQLGADTGDTYRMYQDPSESIEDLILYFDAVDFPTDIETLQEYAEELKIRNYYEDSTYNYFRGLNYHYQLL